MMQQNKNKPFLSPKYLSAKKSKNSISGVPKVDSNVDFFSASEVDENLKRFPALHETSNFAAYFTGCQILGLKS